ncbi:hypothetical protein [Alcanivorax sp.]|jgi:uncharacterized integral membrane protein|uniref:hypothetical protein n=1 Tax=Alcanivorax sp. TaxID=1872427 RepID=UPI0032D97C8B
MDDKTAKKPSLVARGGRKTGHWLMTHPMGALQILLVIMAITVVFQNLEPTSIDILFWTLMDIPKLVLLMVSMLFGALVWETLRRVLRRHSTAKQEH